MELSWAPGVLLRGDVNKMVYFVRSETGQSIAVMSESTTINGSIGTIQPGSDHEFQVINITRPSPSYYITACASVVWSYRMSSLNFFHCLK